MIYIDPPYNTGNDFIYNDDFTDPLEAYLEYTGAKGEGGELLTTNTRADGRFHSKWLNMMYPRLILARQLMQEDGVIFVSIDDNEVHNLRHLLNEVFGEENFVADIVIINNLKGRNDKEHIATAHERLLMFKSPNFQEIGLRMPGDRIDDYDQSDERGKYRLLGLRKRGGADTREKRPNLFYPIYIDPNSGQVSCEKDRSHSLEVIPQKSDGVDGAWRWGKNTVKRKKDKLIGIIKTTGEWDVYQKDYLIVDGKEKRIKPKSVWFGSSVSSDSATKSFRKLMGNCGFRNPKPVEFIEDLIEYATEEGDIVLDFFAGSGTTGHALYNKNLESGFNRSFLLIQIQEENESNEFDNITEIAKERLRRAGKIITRKIRNIDESAPLLPNTNTNVDNGFKVYKLSKSNYKRWKNIEDMEIPVITSIFDDISTPLVKGWKKDELLTEVLLLEGFPLTSQITYLDEVLQNEVYSVSAQEFCDHNLFVCLDDTIEPNTIEQLELEKDDIFICLDSALTDELKAQLQDKFNVHVI